MNELSRNFLIEEEINLISYCRMMDLGGCECKKKKCCKSHKKGKRCKSCPKR